MNAARGSATVVAGLCAAGFALSACSTSAAPEPSTSATPEPSASEFAYVGVRDSAGQAETQPADSMVAAKWRSPTELAFTSFGSSRCYYVPTTVEAAGSQNIRIVAVYGAVTSPGKAHKAFEGETVCTADLRPTTFLLKNPGVNSSKPATLTVSGQLPGDPTPETVTVAPYAKA